MKINLKTVQIAVLVVCSLLFFPIANAEGLDLSSGKVQVVDSNTISLHNIAADNRFYNAEIELNLDGTYRIKTAEQAKASDSARYEVVFESAWSSETHPYKYPDGSSHFSGLIGATHQSNLRLWSTGQKATPGIEDMAETGSKSELENEIEDAIDDGLAENLLSGGGIGSSPGKVSLKFDISQSNPFVTLVSMIAPSPDWFVGVSALSLIEQGDWIEELEIPLFAYDAGTDSGTSYTSGNRDTSPKDIITRLQDRPFLVDGILTPLGSFKFKRISE